MNPTITELAVTLQRAETAEAALYNLVDAICTILDWGIRNDTWHRISDALEPHKKMLPINGGKKPLFSDKLAGMEKALRVIAENKPCMHTHQHFDPLDCARTTALEAIR